MAKRKAMKKIRQDLKKGDSVLVEPTNNTIEAFTTMDMGDQIKVVGAAIVTSLVTAKGAHDYGEAKSQLRSEGANDGVTEIVKRSIDNTLRPVKKLLGKSKKKEGDTE